MTTILSQADQLVFSNNISLTTVNTYANGRINSVRVDIANNFQTNNLILTIKTDPPNPLTNGMVVFADGQNYVPTQVSFLGTAFTYPGMYFYDNTIGDYRSLGNRWIKEVKVNSPGILSFPIDGIPSTIRWMEVSFKLRPTGNSALVCVLRNTFVNITPGYYTAGFYTLSGQTAPTSFTTTNGTYFQLSGVSMPSHFVQGTAKFYLNNPGQKGVTVHSWWNEQNGSQWGWLNYSGVCDAFNTPIEGIGFFFAGGPNIAEGYVRIEGY